MKTKDIAKKYKIDQEAFDEFISSIPEVKKEYGMMGSIQIEDDIVENTVSLFLQKKTDEETAERALQSKKEHTEKNPQTKNGIAKLLKVIAIITLISGGALLLSGQSDIDRNLVMICAGLGGLLSAAFIRGFAEIIELLQGIRDNTEKAE